MVKSCRVLFRDARGIEHAVRVEASSRYHAFGLALFQMRQCQWCNPDSCGVQKMTVELLATGQKPRMAVTRDEFEQWMIEAPNAGNEERIKRHLRMLLGREEPDRDFKKGMSAR